MCWPPGCCCCCSTHDLPHKQLFMRLKAGGVPYIIMVGLPHLCGHHCWLENNLRAVAHGDRGRSIVTYHYRVVPADHCSWSFVSGPPRGGQLAPPIPCEQVLIALEGKLCSAIPGGPLLLLSRSIMIHPTSSGSQGWKWVLCHPSAGLHWVVFPVSRWVG